MTDNLQRWRAERRVLTDLLADVGRRRDPRLVWTATLAETFVDREALLVALAARWSAPLHGHLDAVLDLPDGERDRAASEVAAQLAAREPALHAVLLHHAHEAPVARARARDAARADVPRAAVHAEHVPPRFHVAEPRVVRLRCPLVTRWRSAAPVG